MFFSSLFSLLNCGPTVHLWLWEVPDLKLLSNFRYWLWSFCQAPRYTISYLKRVVKTATSLKWEVLLSLIWCFGWGFIVGQDFIRRRRDRLAPLKCNVPSLEFDFKNKCTIMLCVEFQCILGKEVSLHMRKRWPMP